MHIYIILDNVSPINIFCYVFISLMNISDLHLAKGTLMAELKIMSLSSSTWNSCNPILSALALLIHPKPLQLDLLRSQQYILQDDYHTAPED